MWMHFDHNRPQCVCGRSQQTEDRRTEATSYGSFTLASGIRRTGPINPDGMKNTRR